MKYFLSASILAASLSIGPQALALPLPQRGESQDRLQSDQVEIRRRADRLHVLMQDLLTRYQKQKRTQQVELLTKGLEHLENSGLLDEVAAISTDLESEAFNEAMRKQRVVIEDLERLLDILLDRRSVENLDEQIKTAARLAAEARALEQRQRELQTLTREAARAEPTAAEQQLIENLNQLAQRERDEARANQLNAGLRRPDLELALARIRQLLQNQTRLEETARRELAGEPDPLRDQIFRLGELQEQVSELMRQRSTEQRLARISRDANQLRQAAQDRDPDQVREARDLLRARLDEAAERQRRMSRGATGRRDPAAADLATRLEELAAELGEADQATQTGMEDLQDLATQADEIAKQAGQAQATANEQTGGELQGDLRELAAELNEEYPQTRSGNALERAAGSLADSQNQAQQGDLNRALATLTEALRQMAEAARRLRDANPDAETLASSMAAAADNTARGLENAPQAQEEERNAAASLNEAENNLRQTAQAMGETEDAERAQRSQQGMQGSRERLEEAQRQLQAALDQENQPNRERMQTAAGRQADLSQQAQQLQQSMDRAQQSGGITPEQRDAASRSMQSAQQNMQRAQQSLERGMQDTGARQQQDAAENLEQAQRALEQNRPISEEQKQALRELAKQQEELAEDIIRLAKEAEERRNRNASDALDNASNAAHRARQSMETGDPEETDNQQQETRDRLNEAAEEMEEERDRYMDLRQEELLFRIKQELEQFLETQRPITQDTQQAGEALAGSDRITRVMRRKLNDFGEKESELASRTEFIQTALEEEGNQVFSFVLRSNREDLESVAERLAGRRPDPGELTVMLQKDVERRTVKLLEALEQERREREEQQQQQQQPPGENQFNPQREQLVRLVAELKMLKQLEMDMQLGTQRMQLLVDTRSGDGLTEVELSLVERLANRHNELTRLFMQIKSQMEAAMAAMDGGGEENTIKEGGR